MKDPGTEQYVKVLFELEQDEDGYPPASAETLWAIKVGEGLFQIDNIPFFAYGIAVNDIVSATPEEGVFRYKEVVRPSGHSSHRVVAGAGAGAEVRPGSGPMGLRGGLPVTGLIRGPHRPRAAPEANLAYHSPAPTWRGMGANVGRPNRRLAR
jgi:hypothetical protein